MMKNISKILSVIIIVGLISATFLSAFCFAANQVGWLSGWSYRRCILLHNYSSSGLSDYQVKVDNAINDESGLLASWHFEALDGSFTFDASGRGKNAVVYGASLITGKSGKGLHFNGASDYIDGGNIGLVRTVEFYIDSYKKSAGILELNPEVYISVASGRLNTTGLNAPKIYVNGKASDLLLSGLNHIVITTDTAIAATAVKIGVVESDYFQGVIDEARFYDWQLQDSDVSVHYQRKAELNYSDVRFTDSDGTTLLKYYMEKNGSFWVKVPRLEVDINHPIYMYYGNNQAASLSDGKAVFDFFEDFQSQDLSQWKSDGWDISSQRPAGEELMPRMEYSALSKIKNAKLERILSLPSANMIIEIYGAINGDLLQNYLIFYEDNKKKIIWDETAGGWAKRASNLSSANPTIKFLLKTDGEHTGGIDTIFVRKHADPGVTVDMLPESSR